MRQHDKFQCGTHVRILTASVCIQKQHMQETRHFGIFESYVHSSSALCTWQWQYFHNLVTYMFRAEPCIVHLDFYMAQCNTTMILQLHHLGVCYR